MHALSSHSHSHSPPRSPSPVTHYTIGGGPDLLRSLSSSPPLPQLAPLITARPAETYREAKVPERGRGAPPDRGRPLHNASLGFIHSLTHSFSRSSRQSVSQSSLATHGKTAFFFLSHFPFFFFFWPCRLFGPERGLGNDGWGMHACMRLGGAGGRPVGRVLRGGDGEGGR